jgi:hypothetical protein
MAVIIIVGYAGGLGVVFILLNETELEEVGVIILGMVILIAVPATAAVVQQIVEKE